MNDEINRREKEETMREEVETLAGQYIWRCLHQKVAPDLKPYLAKCPTEQLEVESSAW